MRTRELIYGIVLAMSLSACSSNDVDLTDVNNRIDNVEQRVTKLETTVTNLNNDLATLTTLVKTLESRNYVVKVEETSDGHRITFGDGTVANIRSGQNGNTPVIGIKQDTDGNYYWTIGGEWLTDNEGNQIRANSLDGSDGKDGEDGNDGKDGKDGITPLIRINPTTTYWEVSTDEGKTWTVLTDDEGKPYSAVGINGEAGDSFFKYAPYVDEEKGTVTFTLLSGATIVVPYFNTFKAVRDRLQSLVYMPEHNDGMMTISDAAAGTATLSYTVRPAAIAQYMADNSDKLSLLVLDGLKTRGISTTAKLDITEVKSSVSGSNGIVTLTVKSQGFDASNGYAVALCFSDGFSDYTTAYTHVWVKMTNPTAAIEAEDGTKSGGTIGIGHGIQLLPVIKPGDAVKSWTVDNKNVAIIDGDGWLTPLAEGVIVVTLTTVQGATATFTLNISSGEVDVKDEGVDQNKAESRLR